MKKKEYIKPEVNVMVMETSTILAGSTTIKMATETDYEEENVKSFWNSDHGIDAD